MLSGARSTARSRICSDATACTVGSGTPSRNAFASATASSIQTSWETTASPPITRLSIPVERSATGPRALRSVVVDDAKASYLLNIDAHALASELRTRIEGEVRFDAGSRALYATDASNYRQVPIGIVVPRTIDDVVETIALCREHGAPVLSRGGGTSLCGQCCNVAVVMDMSKYLGQILALDPDRRLARVEPGAVLDDLRRVAERHRLTFAPDSSYAEILRTFELLFDRLPPELQLRVEDVIGRMLSALGDHVLTNELEAAFNGLIATLENAGRCQTAGALRAAKDKLALSIGKLGARSTRAG